MKGYMIAIIVALVGLLALSQKQSKHFKEDAARQKDNFEQSQKVIGEFNVTSKELSDGLVDLSGTTKSLIESVDNIKIENITNVTEIHNHNSDTVFTIDTLIEDITRADVYPFSFIEECVAVYGKVDLTSPQTPKIEKDSIISNNISSIVGYVNRSKGFWFLEWGPWESNLEAKTKCGTIGVKNIKVDVKKRKKK